MQGHKRYNGSFCQGAQASNEEYPKESPHISHQINGGASICIHEEDVRICTHLRNSGTAGEGEDILHSHML